MQQTQNSTISAILYVLAWLACSVLLIADVLVLRQATLDIVTAVQQQQIENSSSGEQHTTRINAGFVKEMIDRAIIILGGITAVALGIYIEYYFRTGRQKGVLYPRIGKVFAILLTVLVVSMIVQTLV